MLFNRYSLSECLNLTRVTFISMFTITEFHILALILEKDSEPEEIGNISLLLGL